MEPGFINTETVLTRRHLAIFVIIIMLVSTFFFFYIKDFLLYHIVVELFSCSIAFAIYILTLNTQKYHKSTYLNMLGISFLFIGVFDCLHMFSFEGMGIIQNINSDTPYQLWVAARYLQSLSFLTAFHLFRFRLKFRFLFIVYFLISGILLSSIFYWKIFPSCYIAGIGFTDFKRSSAILISLLYVISLVFLRRKKNKFHPVILICFTISIVASILSEMSLFIYESQYSINHYISNIFKLTSFYFNYRAIIQIGINDPFLLIFKELQQKKEKIMQKNRQIENIFNTITDGVILINLEGEILQMNPIAEALLDIKFSGKIKKLSTTIEYTRPDNTELPIEELAGIRAIKEKCPIKNVVMGLKNKNKDIIWVNSHASPIFNNEGDFLTVTITMENITDLLQSEKALKSSKEKYKMLAEGTEAVIWEYDIHKNISTYTSPQVKKMLGFEAEEWKADMFWFEHIYEKDRIWAVNYSTEKMTQENSYEMEYRFIKKNGDIIWVKDIISVEHNNGKPAKLRGIMIDINTQKQLESDMKTAQIAAEKANKTKSIFLANMSHELRTPLTSIIGFSELLKNNSEYMSQKSIKYIEHINLNSNKLLEMINDILDLSKIETGKMILNKDLFSIENVINL